MVWNVLIVENDPEYGELIAEILDEVPEITAHHRLDLASGLVFLARNAVSACVVDYLLPDGTGIDVVAQAASQGIPCIMTSGVATDHDAAVANYKAGAVDFIIKPIDIETFPLKILNLIRVANGGDRNSGDA